MLLFFLIEKLYSFCDIEIVEKGIDDTDINKICRERCQNCVFATPENLRDLVCLLREKGISQAAVCGWKNQKGNFLVLDTGEIKCYGKDTLGIDYVFCYKKGFGGAEPCYNPCVPYYNRYPSPFLCPFLGSYPNYCPVPWQPLYQPFQNPGMFF